MSIWRRTTPLPPKRHVVEAVHFVHGGNHEHAPVDCSCGWSGIVADFDEHRRPRFEALRDVDLVCINGHQRTAKNTHIDQKGNRRCADCRREAARRQTARKAAA